MSASPAEPTAPSARVWRVGIALYLLLPLGTLAGLLITRARLTELMTVAAEQSRLSKEDRARNDPLRAEQLALAGIEAAAARLSATPPAQRPAAPWVVEGQVGATYAQGQDRYSAELRELDGGRWVVQSTGEVLGSPDWLSNEREALAKAAAEVQLELTEAGVRLLGPPQVR